MAVCVLAAFAQMDVAPRRAWLALDLVILGVALLALIAVGAAIALKTRALAKVDDEPPHEHSLDYYQDLLDRGLLGPEECERIRAQFAAKPPARPTDP